MIRGCRSAARFAACVAIALLAIDGATMAEVFPYEANVETLDNGLKVIVVPMDSGGTVAYWSVVRTGSRDEYEAGRTGFAHFFEHMMFRGTKRFPEAVYNEKLTAIGADTNAYTTDDRTAYHLAFAAEDLDTVMELEADRFRNLDYAEQAFRTEAGAVYGEYRKSKTNPFYPLLEGLHREAFREHTYGHLTIGYEADIKRMPELYDYSKAFFSRYYRPENVVLLVVGDVEPATVMASARRHYGDWEPGYVPPAIVPEPAQKQERRVDVSYPGKTLPIVMLGYKIDAFDPDDRDLVAASVLAELAFGETSEINRDLVLERQIVEFIAADVGQNRDPGLFEVYSRVKDPARIDEVLAEIDATVARFQAEPPAPERVAAVASNLKYSFLMRIDSPDRLASTLAGWIALTGGVAAIDRYFATLDSIEPEDVRRAAERYLQPTRRTVAVLRGEG